MKIKISPTNAFMPGKGIQVATHLEVTCASLELGVKARGNYVLQRAEVIPGEALPVKINYVPIVGGSVDLTPEQFAQWGTDDGYFAKCIALNAGLTPV